MKTNKLEELIRYIYDNIMHDDYDRYINLVFGDTEIIMYVFENEIPIQIHFENVYFEGDNKPHRKLTAEVYSELCRCNIGRGWLKELDDICSTIEDNEHIFKILLEERNEEDD